MPYDPQGSTAALNARGYADNPTGRAQMAAGQPPSGAGAATPAQQFQGQSNTSGFIPPTGGNNVPTGATSPGAALDALWGASASGSMQQFMEMIREFNLNFGNTMATTYGQNFGAGVLAPQTASSLAAQQAGGMLGYIPGYSGLTTGQTQSLLAQQAQTAQAGAGLTGFYAQPGQSQWSPGTFLRLDPNTYDTQQFGDTQLDYVLPSGQLQRVSIPQARAMGWNGDLGSINTLPMQQAVALESAPPSQLPVQTLEGQTTYSNLNTAAQNQALAQAGATGMYTAPATVQPPGTDLNGQAFSSLPQATQQAYYQREGGDWNAAMQAWVNESNANIRQWAQQNGIPVPGGAGTPQETLAAQQQYATQANQLAQLYGQYYSPLAPGQTATAGVNAPQQGQQTQSMQEQIYRQQLDAINAAAALQANPFRQQQVIGQLGNVLGGGPVASFSAPNTVQGVGTAGGTGPNTGMAYMSQMIDDIRGGTNSANSQGVQGVLDAIPTPNKINSNEFLRAAPSTQQMVLQGMQEKYGLDPNDSMAQIKNTLPAFTAPTTFGKIAG